MSGPTVTRSTLRQQIADALRDEVLAGRLCPGTEFTVKQIAEQYGVSATPVREALVDLSAQGLLDSVQHRGFKVHEYSAGDFRGMIEARNLIADGMFAELAQRLAQNAGGPIGPGEPGAGYGAGRPAALLAVRRRGQEAERSARSGDLTVLIGYDLRFWRELTALYGNPYLADFLHRLRVQAWACAMPLLRRQGDLRGRLWAGHTGLVDALLRQDPLAARAAMNECNARSLALVESLADGTAGDPAGPVGDPAGRTADAPAASGGGA